MGKGRACEKKGTHGGFSEYVSKFCSLDLNDGYECAHPTLSYAFVLWGFWFCVLYFTINVLKSEVNT